MTILSLRGVSKSFGALKVTDDVSFELAEGEALGIIGPNGAGKSTLFNLITGNILADAGTVTFLGQDITRTPAMQRCLMGVGRSFQIPQPFGKLTVFENLLVAATHGQGRHEAAVVDEVAEILEATGMIGKANQVSGSLGLLDRKRLELCRALATAPRLLLLDEIAGGPDRGGMPVARRDHPRRPCAGRDHHLDRTRLARADVRRRSHPRAGLRSRDRAGQPGHGHGIA